jgi:RNA polymerase sigma-70 factor, ECF subfamily
MELETDEAVALAIQNGDRDAFGIIIARYEAKLIRYARRFLGRPEAVEDMVQDVFIKAYTNIQSFNPKLRFSPWIYRIAHNTYVNELRRTRHRLHFFDFETDTFLPALTAPETADSDTLDMELKDHLEELMANLKSTYREVLTLYYLEDMSYQEISDIMRIPVTTVGVRLSRARTELRKQHESSNYYHDKT